MLRFLFPRLTPAPERGAALFAAVTNKAREPHWYVAGAVADTVDGRFRVLASVTALAVVRLEATSKGELASVALTERFIEVMESEHREMGLGDPKLGRTVRKLVGSLARRVALWRSAIAGAADWDEAAGESLYGGDAPKGALAHSVRELKELWAKLEATEVEALAEGRIA